MAGLIIHVDFSRNLSKGKTAAVEVFIDGIDANTAGIAQGYIKQMVRNYNQRLNHPQPVPPIETQVIFLYNPGLISSYFFVPGVIGLVLTLTGSLVSSVTIIREKDVGTLEQLLMTPAAGWEILLAKIVPLFVLLMGDVLLASGMARLVFHLPFVGNFLLFLLLSGLYVLVGISIGILLATLAGNQQQVILMSFFFNVPIIQLSGAIAPIESMPPFFQVLSLFDPLRHYVTIARGLILKGVGLEVLWPQAVALLVFVIVLLTVSTKRFRSQLS
jgi:ABC-2 type transport system permease protein